MGVLEDGLMASLKEQYMSQEDRKKTEKSEWKKEIKDLLSKNETLTRFLEINHIKGEFIKECTNRTRSKDSVRRGISGKGLFSTPIDVALNWADTSKEHNYWRTINKKYVEYVNDNKE